MCENHCSNSLPSITWFSQITFESVCSFSTETQFSIFLPLLEWSLANGGEPGTICPVPLILYIYGHIHAHTQKLCSNFSGRVMTGRAERQDQPDHTDQWCAFISAYYLIIIICIDSD